MAFKDMKEHFTENFKLFAVPDNEHFQANYLKLLQAHDVREQKGMNWKINFKIFLIGCRELLSPVQNVGENYARALKRLIFGTHQCDVCFGYFQSQKDLTQHHKKYHETAVFQNKMIYAAPVFETKKGNNGKIYVTGCLHCLNIFWDENTSCRKSQINELFSHFIVAHNDKQLKAIGYKKDQLIRDLVYLAATMPQNNLNKKCNFNPRAVSTGVDYKIKLNEVFAFKNPCPLLKKDDFALKY